ncbi:MAG: NAD(P)/FAD-dependent oxidoreductase [Meiothermus sp.]|nr:NAD(P)/FAD-dependent oxidoreductase [Meiothermus sp.]
MERLDVLVVGAGAAGVGIGVALSKLELNFGILERHAVGHSFAQWPLETRFITPSFTSNAFNLPDLNAVTPDTSPAFSLGKEHPSGPEYAKYLKGLARHYGLPISEGVSVERVEQLLDQEGFIVHTDDGRFHTRFLIWATGEFQFPLYPIEGSEHGIHYGKVKSWGQVRGDKHVVLGGYESGMDAAYNLALLGKEVIVLDPNAPWESQEGEPSVDLAPFTRERLQGLINSGRITLAQLGVDKVEKKRDHYLIHHQEGAIKASNPPIVATGFGGGLEPLDDLFEVVDGKPLLSEKDESTAAKGLFLVGPKVNHLDTAFCFIYKYRARFPVVAEEIGKRLGADTSALELYRKRGMWADDLQACCTSRCAC